MKILALTNDDFGASRSTGVSTTTRAIKLIRLIKLIWMRRMFAVVSGTTAVTQKGGRSV